MGPGIYIHIPFCAAKCRYCSFLSIPYDPVLAGKYLHALKAELTSFPPADRQHTVYIGGGTPTVAGSGPLSSLVRHISGTADLVSGAEITVEANPGTLSGFDAGELLDSGVNRISLGAQSFSETELTMLGRVHSPGEVSASVTMLRKAGFGNIGLDLIYSLPGQTLDGWLSNIDRAVGLGPEHISIYDLSIEPGTPLYNDSRDGLVEKPPESLQTGMYLAAVERLGDAGYERYEISNFARPGFRCGHNMNYWDAGIYHGYGASAVSFDGVARSKNTDEIDSYIKLASSGSRPVATSETLSGQELLNEYVMLSLRTSEGLDLDRYERASGCGFIERHGPAVRRLTDAGYVRLDGGRLTLTDKGVLASSSVISEFF